MYKLQLVPSVYTLLINTKVYIYHLVDKYSELYLKTGFHSVTNRGIGPI